MKQGAIFDMDGTLFDTEKMYSKCWDKAAVYFGREPDPRFSREICGRSGKAMWDKIEEYYPGVDGEALFHRCCFYMEQEIQIDVPEKPGAREILTFLKNCDYKIAVASGSKQHIIEHNLKFTGMEKYFDAVVSGAGLKNGKPAPDIFLMAAARLKVPPEECYVFEDAESGVRAGAAAGCEIIMIPDMVSPTEEIRELCAGVYDDLEEALRALRQEKETERSKKEKMPKEEGGSRRRR